MSTPLDRRRFFRHGVAAGAAAGLASAAWARAAPAKRNDPLRIGLIGAGSRGTYLLRLAVAQGVEVPAVCDVNEAHCQRAVALVAEQREGRRPESYTGGDYDYRRMLERDDLDAVIVGTPMQWHAVMSADAMRAGKDVFCEVAAAVTLDECWDIVHAANESGRIYMMAENCNYYRPVMMILNMVEQGLFGPLSFAECGYVHDCRALAFNPDGSLTWRGELARDYRGNLYPTHALGPVAEWLGIHRGDRMVSLVAMETNKIAMDHFARRHFPEEHPAREVEFRVADSTTVLIRTAKGALIDLRYDTKSARPHPSTTYFSLQGATASYESRIDGIWLEGRSPGYRWESLDTYAEAFDHPMWQEHAAEAAGTGHGGGDYLVVRAFLETLRSGGPSPIDAAAAAAQSAIIPLSQKSLDEGGTVQEIPDFTEGRWEQA